MRRHITLAALAITAVAYVGSYATLKMRAQRIARTYELKGYFFVGVLDDDSFARERTLRYTFAPLIWLDVTLLRGERPAPPFDDRLQ